jgi:hypothetical protein
MKRGMQLLGAGVAGVAVALLVAACTSAANKLIPLADAGPLKGDVAAVEQAAKEADGNCSATQAAIAKTESDFAALPPTLDAGLRNTLHQGIANLRTRALALCEQPPTSTSTTNTSTTVTKPILPPATTPTPTTTPTTTPSTTPTPGPGGGTPAEEAGEEASGGAGEQGGAGAGGNAGAGGGVGAGEQGGAGAGGNAGAGGGAGPVGGGAGVGVQEGGK